MGATDTLLRTEIAKLLRSFERGMIAEPLFYRILLRLYCDRSTEGSLCTPAVSCPDAICDSFASFLQNAINDDFFYDDRVFIGDDRAEAAMRQDLEDQKPMLRSLLPCLLEQYTI